MQLIDFKKYDNKIKKKKLKKKKQNRVMKKVKK